VRSARRRAIRIVLALVAVALPTATALPALAHATLVGTTPAHGVTVETAPESIELRFDGSVDLVEDAFVLRSSGALVDGEVTLEGTTVRFTPATTIPNGTAVLDWRVVSDDGHPIGGKLVFHVREVTVADPVDDVVEPSAGPAVGLLNAIAHLGILLGAGLAFFRVMIHDRGPETPRLMALSRALLTVGVFGALASLFLQGVEIARRVDLGSLPTGSLPMLLLLIAGAALAGLAPGRVPVVVGVAVAVSSLAFVGHTRSFEPTWMVAGADVVHLLAGTLWTGGLAGLALVARSRRPEAADQARRFGRYAIWCLVAVFGSGLAMTWRIHGSLPAAIDTTHGRLILAKVVLVVLAAAIAIVNRRAASPGGGEKAGRLRSTVPAEAALVALVLVVSGFLVDQDPSSGSVMEPSMAAETIQASFGPYTLAVRFEPGTPGVNTVKLTVLDGDGRPAELWSAPIVLVSDDGDGRASYETEPSAEGFETTVEIPDTARWSAEVRARIGSFEEGVQAITYGPGDAVIPGSGLAGIGVVMPEPPGGATSAVVYATIVPSFDGTLVAGESPVCEEVSLHESVINPDGTATMMHRDEIPFTAGEPLTFSSGGLHVMCEGVDAGLGAGDRFPLVLMTDDGNPHWFGVEVVPFSAVLE